jgi:branched-subunit amino acid aminotransferase/4-amino-4-deoxychorismate lyase
VREAAAREPSGRAVVRVVLDQGGTAAVTARPAPVPAAPTALSCAPRPAGCWRHKWADRSWAAADTLFVGADGTVLETERGNVFLIEPDGTLVTPRLREDLLPGVTRRALLDLARDTGRPTVLRPFGVPEMTARPAFWTSSLNGAVPIATVDGVALPRANHLVRELRAGLLGGDPPIR